jgi:hypothetical protein
MALEVFKLPGGDGGLRKPYLMPTDAEVELHNWPARVGPGRD